MKINVLIVIDSLGPGGAQRQIIEYFKFADRDAFDIKVVNLDRDYAPLADEITRLGVEIVGIDHRGFFNPKTLIELVMLFRRGKPDIVHTYLFTSDCYGRLAAQIAGVKTIICSIRSTDLWKKWHHILADRILEKFTDRLTINAENMRRFLVETEKLDPKKITCIYNGIDLRRFESLRDQSDVRKGFNIPEDALVVGMVSRFSAQKDYKTFFASAEIVGQSEKNVYFVAVGDGPQQKGFEEQWERKDISSRVVFTGLRHDVPDLMNMMDIGVLATHYEGCPNVVLEYMACAKPVVATNVDGCPELIVDGKTGFLVPERDAAAMAEKLMILIKDANLRRRMGEAGRKRVEENFTSKKMAENIERLYLKLLDESGGGSQ